MLLTLRMLGLLTLSPDELKILGLLTLSTEELKLLGLLTLSTEELKILGLPTMSTEELKILGLLTSAPDKNEVTKRNQCHYTGLNAFSHQFKISSSVHFSPLTDWVIWGT